MKSMLKAIVFAALALGGIAQAGDFPDISVADLKKVIAEKKVTIIDVNGSDSWKEGHVPGAVDFSATKEKIAAALPKEKNALVVAYCGGPGCSAYKAAANAAKDLGYTNVKHLSAGISGWKSAGEKTEAGKVEKKKEGVVSNGAGHKYVAIFSGVTCCECKTHVTEAVAKLPGGSCVEFAAGEKEGTQKVTFNATCDQVCKDKLVAALGDGAKTYIVQELALAAK